MQAIQKSFYEDVGWMNISKVRVKVIALSCLPFSNRNREIWLQLFIENYTIIQPFLIFHFFHCLIIVRFLQLPHFLFVARNFAYSKPTNVHLKQKKILLLKYSSKSCNVYFVNCVCAFWSELAVAFWMRAYSALKRIPIQIEFFAWMSSMRTEIKIGENMKQIDVYIFSNDWIVLFL